MTAFDKCDVICLSAIREKRKAEKEEKARERARERILRAAEKIKWGTPDEE